MRNITSQEKTGPDSKGEILFIDPSPINEKYGGSTICLLELLEQLKKSGWKERARILFLYPNVIAKKFDAIEDIETVSLFKKYSSNSRIEILKKYILFFLYLFRSKNIGLIVINSRLGSGRFAVFLSKLFNIPVVVHERLESKVSYFEKYIFDRVKIITMSDYLKEYLINQNVSSKNIITVYDGVKVKNLKEENYSKEKNVIMVGNIMPWKGQETFVKSYKYLKTKNVKYYLAGEIFDNIYFSNISKYFNKEIIYLGFIDDIMSCIKRYKILVHASQKPEPFGRTIIEAMSLGVPVIASNTGGPKESIKNNITGYHFDSKSPKDLAKKIDSVFKNEDETRKVINNALVDIKDVFNIEISSKKILDIYMNTRR